MIFHEEFYLNCPAQEAWEFFSDFPAPIKALPGFLQVRETGPRQYVGAVKSHLGPIGCVFQGEMTIIKVDHRTQEVVVKGAAQDQTLGGHFTATAYTRTLAAGPHRTRVTLEVHVGLGGALGKLGVFLLKPKAHSIVQHYAELVSREVGRRRVRRALQATDPAPLAVASVS
jgi:carbon monoxide dehydrogenase subunit G